MMYRDCRQLLGTALVALFAMGLVACGGGGDDGGGGGVAPGGPSALTVTIPTAPVAITDANAETIAGEALANSNVGDVGGSVPVTPFNTQGAPVLAGAWSPQTAIRFASQRLTVVPSENDEFQVNAAQACSGGGTVDIIDNGTSGSATFINCIESGTTINGSVFASNVVDTANEQSATLVFQGFSMTDGSTFLAIHGDIRMSVVTDGGGVRTETISGSSFASQFNNEAFRLSNFNLTSVFNPNDGTTTETANFSYAGTDISGSITIQTTVPFVTNAGDFYPSTGQAVATGSNGSKCRLTAIDNVNVLLEVDADGNGDYESTINTTWAALDAAA